jgi:hypothetical protein
MLHTDENNGVMESSFELDSFQSYGLLWMIRGGLHVQSIEAGAAIHCKMRQEL